MFVSIHTMDMGTGAVAERQSLTQYHQALDGAREFPYQWRLLGIYLVYAGERTTGLPPHTIDVVVKTTLLFASSMLLFVFSRAYVSEIGGLCAVALYLVATIAGFTDQYTIYFTNDFAMIVCWFAAVYCVRSERWAAAAAFAFVGAWAKETMMLVPILVGLRWLRGRAPLWAVVLTGVAFVVPTAVLRQIYRAPLKKWAWWDMAFANVPFLQRSFYEFKLTVKNNVKVFLLYNAMWIVWARETLRTADTFQKDLAITAIAYLCLAYPVIYIRELRHFLPLAIVLLPPALAAIERRAR
jgi:hypothetical protein